ncbi:hypothetical protein CcrC1_gp477 [Caulobacter phage C1]|nr:hypothetical protein CcrC1_gp477 [Caulobacter phage C1]UTU08686.1 hypothetical protein CcrC2_gp459 [Caulobacter phage C2]WGN97352.1 hypothetical protein [Bertelyvirus sp.]WGN97890.1 hypothetical protein [Bertelyvirus sp.]
MSLFLTILAVLALIAVIAVAAFYFGVFVLLYGLASMFETNASLGGRRRK